MSAALDHGSMRRPEDGEALPRHLAGFRNRHAGGTIVVCGCGTSLRDLTDPGAHTTIGVNDVGRLFTPDYLLVVNTRHQFAAGRFDAVEQSRARALFTHLDLRIPHPHIVRFALGRRGGVDFGNPDVLNYTRNSPYLALGLAIHMGATRIGLIGVDFTNGHFFGGSGPHPLVRELAQIDAEYRRLGEACAAAGIEIVNLSAASRLTAFPKVSPDAFAVRARPARRLRIVSYATMPVSGVPAILARAIAHATPHEGRAVWARDGYGNGISFAGDVAYEREPGTAAALLEAADLVVVHNGKVDRRHAALIDAKPVVTLAHNALWNVDPRFVTRGDPGLVVGQYQATLAEFAGWSPVPNPIPLWDETHAAGTGRAEDGPVTICYLPANRHESFPPGDRLFWHAKGYRTTMAALDDLARRRGIRLAVARQGQVPHHEAMAMKRRAHIVIDECATGSYHRTSLEGLAAGAVVVNGVGRLAGLTDVLRLCADGADTVPFVSAGPGTLHAVLDGLIALGPRALIEQGRRNRLWMERHWRFERQWPRFWMPAIEQALAVHARRAAPRPRFVPQPAPPAPTPPPLPVPPARLPPLVVPPRMPAAAPGGGSTRAITAVVPFAGAERLPALGAVLAALRDQDLAGVIVVEADAAACARTITEASGMTYVVSPGPLGFDKARVMNVGAGFVRTPFLLWWDADLLAPPGFAAGAIDELHRRRLDYLVPWWSIRYLGEPDSRGVVERGEDGFAAAPVRTVFSRHGDRAGAGLLRTAFLEAHGGVCEDFTGLGGETEAFFHKATLFGRAAATRREAAHLCHLFHPRTRALLPPEELMDDAREAGNRTRLREIRATGSRSRFLHRFPAPIHPRAPWPGVLRLACAPGAAALGRALARHYGAAVALCGEDERPDAVLPRPDGAGDDPVTPERLLAAAAGLMLDRRPCRERRTGAAAPKAVHPPLAPARRRPASDVVCAMHVRNQAAHIGEALESVLPLSGTALVFDDHSDDGTPEVCARFGARVEVIRSPYDGRGEARDKNALLRRLIDRMPGWVLWIDGDEVLERSGPDRLRAAIADEAAASVYALQLAFLWDHPDRIRTDGRFGCTVRPSLFRFRGGPVHRFVFPYAGAGDRPCGNVPRGAGTEPRTIPVRLKSYACLTAEMRPSWSEPGPPVLAAWHDIPRPDVPVSRVPAP